jgi:hypothetical protein
MTQKFTDERLEAALLALTQSVQVLIEEKKITNTNINNLVEHLYTRNDVVAVEIYDALPQQTPTAKSDTTTTASRGSFNN